MPPGSHFLPWLQSWPVTCFGQWDISKHSASRDLKKHFLLGLALSCCSCRVLLPPFEESQANLQRMKNHMERGPRLSQPSQLRSQRCEWAPLQPSWSRVEETLSYPIESYLLSHKVLSWLFNQLTQEDSSWGKSSIWKMGEVNLKRRNLWKK